MKIRYVFVFTVILLFLVVLCKKGEGEDLMNNEDELREYKGEKLSSIDDFRENSIKGPQFVEEDEYELVVSGLVEREINLTYDEVLDRYEHHRRVITMDCVEGWSVKLLWEGVLVEDILKETGIKPEAEVVIFHSVDGYTTSVELDYLLDNDIIMAFKMNGVPLPPERGFPFQLVAEGKWGYKWAKWISEIELSEDVDFRGFWENRGFSNSADLDEPFYD